MGRLAGAAFALLLVAAPARADMVTRGSDRDTTLYGEDGTLSNGAGDYFFAGTTDGGAVRRALVAFDVAGAVPAGSTITSVTLSLYCSRVKSNTAYAVSLHRVTAAWGEGTSHADGEEGAGAPATAGDATFSHRVYALSPWAAPGGDHVGAASATTPVDREGRRFAWSTTQMVADVQRWLDAPAENHGWLLIGVEGVERSSKRFDSGDSADISARPILTVTFTPAAAMGACCAPGGSCSDGTAVSCSGSYRGDGTSCAEITCPLPTGACCAAGGGCTLTTAAACSGSYEGDATTCSPSPCPVPRGACCSGAGCSLVDHPGTACAGSYLGAGTSCSPDPCLAATGACCAADGACSIVVHPGTACTGGYQGRDTTCSPGRCPLPTGACCAGDGSCTTSPAASCTGSWLGPTTACSPSPCPQPTGACCAPDGSCAVQTDALCSDAWSGPGTTCSPSPCPAPAGACCSADGGCASTREADCSGSWLGALSSCVPDPCPDPIGACCAVDGGCSVTTGAACGGSWRGAGSACAAERCGPTLAPFVDPLPRPAVAVPVLGIAGGEAEYRMAAVELRQQLHRDLPPTVVWGFDDGSGGGSYPGPTIEARSGSAVRVTWVNDLRDGSGALRTEHVLPVDRCPHGAADASPRIVEHLHGGHVPAASDGYPESTILPGGSRLDEYPNGQQAGTLWYHDHAIGITRLNVMMGLAGFYLVRDDVEEALGLPGGEFEVPLAIQDRMLASDGSLVYPAAWEEHFFGDTILVNGRVWPYLEVARGKYRFRILNGSNSRTYTLSLPGGPPFTVIGGDDGLIETPVTVDEITLGPGERADVVVDFAGLAPGTEILLRNSAPAPYPGRPDVGVVPDVMKLVVVDRGGHTAPLPASLRSIDRLDEADAAMTRDLELRRGDDPCSGQAWLINGLGWEDLTERPALGTSEVWRFVNRSGVAHPMHMHLVHFQVLDRQSFAVVDGAVTPLGSPSPPRPWETGPKDTVMVGANEIVRVIARFEDFVGHYAYHCHILEHEDHSMMRQLETWTRCGDGARGIPGEECDDGNTTPGDGCSPTCTVETGGDADRPDGARPDAGIDDAGSEGGSDAGLPESNGGCSCRITDPRSGPTVAPLLLALAWLLLRQRSGRRTMSL